MSFFNQYPELGYPVVATLGLVIGSFLNVVILRLPKQMEWQWRQASLELLDKQAAYEPPPPGIVLERSHCPSCKHQLSWFENIPLFSWIALRGRCRHCTQPISVQYPLVELLTMFLLLCCVWQFGFGWQGFGASVLTCFLITLSGIDTRTQLLPDQLTLPLLWIGLIASTDKRFLESKSALIGAVVGYLCLWLVCWIFKQITGKQGMGHGDFKLLAALGAWVGFYGILPIVLLSSLVGAVIGSIWLTARGRSRGTPIPFGPYLAIAGWLVFFYRDSMISGYWHFFS